MIGSLLNVILFLIPAIIYLAYPSNNFLAFFLVLAIGYLVVNIIASCCAVYNQIDDIEKIEEMKNNKLIYGFQRDDLVSQATLYLGDKYPEHEKELFKLIAEKNSEAVVNLIGAFPEIKSAEVLKDLVTKIECLHEKVYHQDIEIESMKRRIRVRKRNPYTLTCLLPTYEGQPK